MFALGLAAQADKLSLSHLRALAMIPTESGTLARAMLEALGLE
jgi:hypothetical protein